MNDPVSTEKKPIKEVIIRWNVLFLMGMGYLLILIIFGASAFQENITVMQAYARIDAPVMALIGGTIAIAKDLVEIDRSNKSGQDGKDPK